MTLLKALAAELFVLFGAWLALMQLVIPALDWAPSFGLIVMAIWLLATIGTVTWAHLDLID